MTESVEHRPYDWWTPAQRACVHEFERMPSSATMSGLAVDRCPKCDARRFPV